MGEKKTIRVIECFAGIGGFRKGLEQASNKYQIVWANEIDKFACQIYRKNFGEGELYEGDIRTVQPEDIPKAEMLVGGFPCQAFSITGKRKGFEDTRGTLFYEIVRIARANRYKTLFLENVKGLLNHENGSTFETILGVLDELGYDVEWDVLNSKAFGVPQNRERVFVVCHLRGSSRRQVFPLKKNNQPVGEVRIKDSRQNSWDSQGENGRSAERRKVSTAIDSCYYKGINAGSQGGKNSFQKCRRQTIGEIPRIRRLTPTECERLQGFPDGWTQKGIAIKDTSKMTQVQLDILDQRPEWIYHETIISDTQRYKCLGNAVTTTVIEAIGRKLHVIS